MYRKSHPPKILLVSLLRSLVESGKRTLYVGNSGDFYIDRATSQMGFDVHASDPTIFGRCIGALLTDKKFELRCKDIELNSIFDRWPEHRLKPLVQIQFTLRAGKYAARKNSYQRARYRTCLEGNLPFFHKSICALERNQYLNFRIATFRHGDFTDHFAQAPTESHCLLNLLTLPVLRTKVLRFAEHLFSCDDMKPTLKGQADYASLFQSESMSVFSDKLLDGMDIWLKGKADRPNGREPVFLYSNLENLPAVFRVGKKTKPVQEMPRTIPANYIIPDDVHLSVIKCKPSLVFHYKHLFMSSRVNYSDAAELALAFLVDGAVFGFASFSQRTRSMDRNRYIFMNSDFVLPSATPRLSKLLLYLLRSSEVRCLVARQYLFSYPSIQTSVFTDKPVSMKYRGTFQKAGKNTNGKLTYTADFTTELLKEERFEQWKKQTMTKR